MQRMCSLFVLILLWHQGMAQNIQFHSSVSSTRVAQHTVFDVQFELQDAKGADFKPPSFEGFKVVGGPALGSSTTIINGAVSSSQTWSYSLLATRQGKFTIGSASVVAGRKKLNSKPITIDVIEPRDLSQKEGTDGREPIYLKANVPKGPFYPGQQIILTYTLLFRENVQTVSTLSEDDYADFFIQLFQEIPTETKYETINGMQFATRIVKAIALFAHQSGTFTIDPMLMSVGINAPFPSMHGLFTMRRIQDMQVASEPLTVTIKPLPSGAPSSFTGAVGTYSIQAMPGALQISTDDALTFQLQITGDGDARRWDLPVPVTDGAFEVYDPKVVEDRIEATGTRADHNRIANYQMIPSTPGRYIVYVPFTYFDPATEQYHTITSDTLHVQVTPGQRGPGVAFSSDSSLTKVPALLTVRAPLFRDDFWLSVPHLLLFGLILSGTCWGWFSLAKQKRIQRIPESEKLKNAALDKAMQKLQQLSNDVSRPAGKLFFEPATEIYTAFLMDRFSIPASELDEAGINRYLHAHGLKEDHIRIAVRLFNDCLAVRYGGIPGGYTKEQMITVCQNTMTQLAG